MQRTDKRNFDQLREISITPTFNIHAEGSALTKFGNTHVICNATIEKAIPRWMTDVKTGWVTAEYGMLPRSTNERMNREAQRGKQSGRTLEIQRLIGRSLRQVVDLKKLTGYTITVDCDVIQADGGTRTASINGAWIALNDTFTKMVNENKLVQNPLTSKVGAISVGIVDGEIVADLDYAKDSNAEVDLNLVLDEKFEILEIQGTAEGKPFSKDSLDSLFNIAKECVQEIFKIQN